MLQPRLIPLLLIKDGKLQKSQEFRSWRYVGDPATAISIFNDKAVDELMILDVDATARGTGPNLAALKELAKEAFVPLSYGGGVTSRGHAAQLVEIGFDRVVVNSAFSRNPNLISEISSEIGRSSTSVSFDVEELVSGDWEVFRGQNAKIPKDIATKQLGGLTQQIALAEELGAGEVVVQNKSRDGLRKGLDLKLAQFLMQHVKVPLVIGGGYADIAEARNAWSLGVSGVAVGATFVFMGKNEAVMLNYPVRNSGLWLP